MSAADSLFAQLETQLAGQSLPPVQLWQPAREGRIDIRIAQDGTWYHEGSPIPRPAMVRVFASIMRRDEDGYALVTPAEKLLIGEGAVDITYGDLRLRADRTLSEP